MRSIPLAMAGVLFAQVAVADIYTECARAISENDASKALELATTLLRFNSIAIQNQDAGAACLSYAMGEEYVYSIGLSTLSSKREEDARIEAAKAEAAERNAEQKKLQAEEEMLQLAQRKAELAIEAEKQQRQEAVWKRVLRACEELYQSDPTSAVTNRICLDVFLETGLPG
jgi:hypothetical protein